MRPVLFVAVASALTMTSGTCKHEASELPVWVDGYCRDFETQLKKAAERHRQLAPALDANRLTADQERRAESDLRMTSVGVTEDARYARTWAFSDRLRFCVTVHRIDAHRRDEIDLQDSRISEALVPAVSSGRMPTAAETSALLDKWYALAREVNAAPLKQ